MSWEEVRLFEVADIVDDEVPASLSYTRRLTLKRQLLIERGVHPATRLPIRQGACCGSCRHHLVSQGRARWFHKCALVGLTRGPATDIRTGWPACSAWEADRPSLTAVADIATTREVL